MFLIDNLLIHCLEWDYPLDSSSLPAVLQWISFVLESTLSKNLWIMIFCSSPTLICMFSAACSNFSLLKKKKVNPSTIEI